MYLGIDLGTSSAKLILLDDQQRIVASSSSPLSVSRPQELWSEQAPADWWTAVQKAFLDLKQEHNDKLMQLRAIGLSGQMHGATLLDKKNRVLRPAILWNDGRSFNECTDIKNAVPQAEQITGNLLFPGFTAPKLLWIKNHEPEIFKAINKVLLPKDYIRFCLTHTFASDLSDSSGTSWLDVGKRRWSDDMLAATELTQAHMPELFEGTEITATITKEIATLWGIPEDTVVVAGGGDNAASAVSMNVMEPGQAFLSLGTSGVYFTADDAYRPNPDDAIHTMCHCLPNRWHEMNVHLSAASCLSWYAKHVAHKRLPILLAEAEAGHTLDAPLFLPHLSGERTPYNNPYAKAVFFGMTHNTNRGILMQSVLEGVAFLVAQGQQALEKIGVPINDINVIGGGAISKYWGEILASALNRPLTYRHSADVGGAYGAAKLAWLGIHGGNPATVLTLPPIDYVINPNADWTDAYAHKLEKFKKVYANLEELF
ncbi:MAG: xylulokinase [Coxiella sp. (in: Bacteria)]|nr:MAG: xylulokinase [Coxiella sp. (in: g-proteobacteria)]